MSCGLLAPRCRRSSAALASRRPASIGRWRQRHESLPAPEEKKPNHKHWYAYDVEVDGDLLVTDSRDPEHDLARVLLARAVTGNVTIHDGKTGKPRTIVDIEGAAQWCVGSNLDRYKWKPPRIGNNSPPTAEEPLVVPTLPPTANEAA